jgi:hypothetical protein
VNQFFNLSNRKFNVARAIVDLSASTATLDIETSFEEFDGERWAPYLYHHGLVLGISEPESLQGKSYVLAPSNSEPPVHRECGYMYVFGHEELSQAVLHFGGLYDGKIEVFVQGCCDVMWDDAFGANVPFECACLANVIPA